MESRYQMTSTVAGEDAVAGDEGNRLGERLGDEQAIEGVAVVHRKVTDSERMIVRQREQFEHQVFLSS